MKTDLENKLIKTILSAAMSAGYKVESEDIALEHPSDSRYGDYSTNIAMTLAKKEKTNPVETAKLIKNSLDEVADKTDLVEKIEIAGPGFINFYLKNDYLIRQIERINYETEFRNALRKYGENKTVVIDYSAPNIAKPFGIGHLRSTNIGQSLYNIFQILGWSCIGDNHLGDWGTQFGKLIVAVKRWGKIDIEKMSVDDLEKLYVKFHEEAEKNESLVEEARAWFEKLEKGDREARDIWQKCIDISIVEFDRVYRMLNVKIDVTHGESFYEDKLKKTIEDIKRKGLVKESQGALIIEFPDLPPAILVKTNGTTTYFTRDMATIKYRVDQWHPDLIVYEVGADQQLHFSQVFRTAEMMGWIPSEKLVHVAHGLIRWKNGKFSTRKGDTIHLSDVIDKAVEKAGEVANKSVIGKDLKPEERAEMIDMVAIGAIKFNDLAQDPKRDIIFDWDKVMSLDGDSGPYLQYTYARCQSVLRKTKISEQKNIENLPDNLKAEEINLLKELYKLEEKILEAQNRYCPAVVAEFLLVIARRYNEFYGKLRIIDQPEETFRIFLTKACASTLSTGLKLLGIHPLEKM